MNASYNPAENRWDVTWAIDSDATRYQFKVIPCEPKWIPVAKNESFFTIGKRTSVPENGMVTVEVQKWTKADNKWVPHEKNDVDVKAFLPPYTKGEKIQKVWEKNKKKVLIPVTVIAITLAVIGCAKLSGCKLDLRLAEKVKPSNTPVKTAPPVKSEEKSAGVDTVKQAPPVTTSTNTFVDRVLAGLRSPAAVEAPPAPPADTKGISVTNTVAGGTTTINVNGGTINGGINVYNGTVYQGTASGKKTTVSPGDVTEDTFRKVTPGMPSIILEPGEIAYIDFKAGLKNFKFTYDEDREQDVRALYDGQPLSSKHDPQNTQRVTIENTAEKKPLKLDFFGW